MHPGQAGGTAPLCAQKVVLRQLEPALYGRAVAGAGDQQGGRQVEELFRNVEKNDRN